MWQRLVHPDTLHCNRCGTETGHDLLFSKDKTWLGDEAAPERSPRFFEQWDVMQCNTCTGIVFRLRLCDDLSDEIAGTKLIRPVRFATYPPARTRRRPDWLHHLPRTDFNDLLAAFGGRDALSARGADASRRALSPDAHDRLLRLLDEVYEALDQGLTSLAAMGMRAALDVVMVDRVGDAGSFQEKLTAMVRGGHLTSEGRSVLAAAVHVGSAAAHRGHSPSRDDLDGVMNILEHLLEGLFVLPGEREKLGRSTPPRRPPA